MTEDQDPLATTQFTPSPQSWVDMALGRFIRSMPVLETMLFLTASAATGKSIVEQENATVAGAIDDIENRLLRFPQGDRLTLGKAMVDARRVFAVRHNLVHGVWSEVEGRPMTFVSVLPIRSRKGARQLLKRDDVTSADGVTDEEPLSLRLTFNRDLILSVRKTAANVSEYLGECLDVWEEHFEVTYD